MTSLKLCYATDGTLASGNIPCDPNAETSACCGAEVFVSATFIVLTLMGATSRGPVPTKNGALFQTLLVPAIRVRDHVSMYR
jgi:hypothetical protein